MTILVIEDDPRIAGVVAEAFAAEGRRVEHCDSGEDGLYRAAGGRFEAIVLDVLLPAFSGFEICQRLREQEVTTPILMLTCRDRNEDVVRGLRLGADDYMTKPFSTAELAARVEALIRRSQGFGRPRTLRHGQLALDPRARRVTIDQRPVALTAREFDLLAFFLRHPDRAVTRETLLAEVWSEEEDHTLNVVDVYVSYLRRKLGPSGAEIRTVRGYGYILGETG